jgi:hypothetical protein
MECVSSRVWEEFVNLCYTREKYQELVQRAFSITGLQGNACDRFGDLCFNKLKSVLLHQLGKQERGLRTCNPGQTLFGVEHHLTAVKALMGVSTPKGAMQVQGRAQEVGIVVVKDISGVGKTTLAKLVYDNPEVRSFFGGRVCWLVVNQKPSLDKVCQLQEQVLSKLGNAAEVKIENLDIGRL